MRAVFIDDDGVVQIVPRPAAPSATRESDLIDRLFRFGRGAKRWGMLQDNCEDAHWFAELHATLDEAAFAIRDMSARQRGD